MTNVTRVHFFLDLIKLRLNVLFISASTSGRMKCRTVATAEENFQAETLKRVSPVNTSARTVGHASGSTSTATTAAIQAALCCHTRWRWSTARTLISLLCIKIGLPDLQSKMIEERAGKSVDERNVYHEVCVIA